MERPRVCALLAQSGGCLHDDLKQCADDPEIVLTYARCYEWVRGGRYSFGPGLMSSRLCTDRSFICGLLRSAPAIAVLDSGDTWLKEDYELQLLARAMSPDFRPCNADKFFNRVRMQL